MPPGIILHLAYLIGSNCQISITTSKSLLESLTQVNTAQFESLDKVYSCYPLWK